MALKKKKEKGKKSRFNYQGRTKDDVKAASNQKAGSFDTYLKDKYKVYKPREGKNLIRILPPTWDKARHYAYPIYLCYGIGVDNQTYLSLHKMLGKPDPLEEARREAQKDGDEKLAKALDPRKRSLIWVIDRYAEEEGPQIWPAPWTVDRDIAALCYDEDTQEVILIDSPDEGCDIRFTKEGTGLNTNYNAAKMKVLKPSPLSEDEDQMAEWLEYITDNPLPDALNYYEYDHIESVFGGKARIDDDDDDEDEKPSKKKGKTKKPAKGKSRDDEDDDDDDDEDEKPSKKSAKKKPAKKSSKRDEDDEDDDDDDDEDDEESDDDDDEDDEESDDEDESDEDEDDEGDEDDDEDDEDEKPAKKGKGKSSKKDKGSPSRADRIKERLNKANKKRKRD